MKAVQLLFLLSVFSGIFVSCVAQTNKNENEIKTADAENVNVYYFHFSRRCATCMAVESVSQEAVKELYGEKVNFAGYNLDDAAGEKMGKQLNVSGQALLIIKGDTKIDITNEGFMNARSNPDKLKQIIKEKVDPLL